MRSGSRLRHTLGTGNRAVPQVGIADILKHLPEDAPLAEAQRVVRELSAAPEVDGILLQLPVPPHLDDAAIIDVISPLKDVDGLHPETVGCVPAPALSCPGESPNQLGTDKDIHSQNGSKNRVFPSPPLGGNEERGVPHHLPGGELKKGLIREERTYPLTSLPSVLQLKGPPYGSCRVSDGAALDKTGLFL